jgi:hypothetical protein
LLNQDLVLEEASAAGEQAGSVGLATDRAVRETGRLSDALATLLQSNWAELEAGLRANGVSGFYDDLSKTLNPIYADLNKLVSFIQERLGQL